RRPFLAFFPGFPYNSVETYTSEVPLYAYKRSVRAAPPVAGGEKRREADLRLLRERQRGDRHRSGRAPVPHAPGGGGAVFFPAEKGPLRQAGEKFDRLGVLHPAGGGQQRAPAAHGPAGLWPAG